MSDMDMLVITGQKEDVAYSGGSMTRISCCINVRMKDRSEVNLLTIATDRFIRASDKQMETELYLKSKRLASVLCTHLTLHYMWMGYHTT
jgi:hypothetical protein